MRGLSQINAVTEDVMQPKPRIHEALKELGVAKIFQTIDLKSGCWQIPMDSTAQKLTAFTAPGGGTYPFRVMSFGLKSGPNTFQRLVSQEVLMGYIGTVCNPYLDDIILFSNTWEDHLQHLTLVLERLTLHGLLTCAIDKCHFGKNELKYLGHTVTTAGYEAQQEHIGVLDLQKLG